MACLDCDQLSLLVCKGNSLGFSKITSNAKKETKKEVSLGTASFLRAKLDRYYEAEARNPPLDPLSVNDCWCFHYKW